MKPQAEPKMGLFLPKIIFVFADKNIEERLQKIQPFMKDYGRLNS